MIISKWKKVAPCLFTTGSNTMEKDEKKEYEKPVLIQHENLNEVTKGDPYYSYPD